MVDWYRPDADRGRGDASTLHFTLDAGDAGVQDSSGIPAGFSVSLALEESEAGLALHRLVLSIAYQFDPQLTLLAVGKTSNNVQKRPGTPSCTIDRLLNDAQ